MQYNSIMEPGLLTKQSNESKKKGQFSFVKLYALIFTTITLFSFGLGIANRYTNKYKNHNEFEFYLLTLGLILYVLIVTMIYLVFKNKT